MACVSLSSPDLGKLRPLCDLHSHAAADPLAVATTASRAHQFDDDPSALVAAPVQPQACGTAKFSTLFLGQTEQATPDEDIRIAIVIEIADRQAAAPFPVKFRRHRHVFELAVVNLLEQSQSLIVRVVAAPDEEIQSPVTVGVEPAHMDVALVPALDLMNPLDPAPRVTSEPVTLTRPEILEDR